MRHKYITVFTDGSYCPYTKSGGWAYWIKFGNGKTVRGQGHMNGAASPLYLEMEAINRALYRIVNNAPDSIIVENPMDVIGAKVIVQTDCAPAIDAIRRNGALTAFLSTHKFLAGLEFRHVRAHQGLSDRRSAVNTWCDEAARQEMAKQRKLAQAENNRKHDQLPANWPDFIANAVTGCPFDYPDNVIEAMKHSQEHTGDAVAYLTGGNPFAVDPAEDFDSDIELDDESAFDDPPWHVEPEPVEELEAEKPQTRSTLADKAFE